MGFLFKGASTFKIPPEILINKKAIALKLFNENSSRTAFIDIFLDDCYGLLFFKQRILNIQTIIDIGANQGLFVLHARNIFPDASIAAYEPNELVMASLSYHSTIATAHYYPVAVGLTGGKILLISNSDTLHGKTFLNNEGNITQISIAECLAREGNRVDLLKLDCEGAEWKIFKDADALKKVKAITLEYHLDDEHMDDHKNKHETVIEILEANNFNILNHKISDVYWGIVWAENKSLL